MKKVILVNIEFVFISNETFQPVKLTESQKLLSSIFPDKYCHVEIYTPIKTFTAKTFKKLEEMIDTFSTENKIYDFHCKIIKN